MHIPKTFKLKNKRWKVAFDPKLFEEGLCGTCYPTKHKIFIDPGLTRNEIEETFVHELIHACWPKDACGERLEEKIVEQLSRTLYELLKKNKKLLQR